MKSTNESQHSMPGTADNEAAPYKHTVIFNPRWAVIMGILAIGFLYLALPESLTFGPSWLLLAIEAVLLIPLLFIGITQRPVPHITLRFFAFAVLAVVTLGLAASIVLLVNTVITGSTKGSFLLRSAALLWITNILVFALWYWEIDGGGPHKRHMSGHQAADFMFPQQADGNKTGWVAEFVDYLFVAFTGATALSPADTFPLTRPAKLLMMTEAMLSLIIIVLLAARAVNILGS
ncbi:MAG TPA: hypothetical protein VEL31_32045 [Ktedonobacteraceae bacterium]|nr:hypothetical protein [Ktedonobacteraceae bacterium]